MTYPGTQSWRLRISLRAVDYTIRLPIPLPVDPATCTADLDLDADPTTTRSLLPGAPRTGLHGVQSQLLALIKAWFDVSDTKVPDTDTDTAPPPTLSNPGT